MHVPGGVEPRPYAVHTVIRYGKTGKGLTERHIGRSLRGRGDPAMGNVEKCAVSRNDTQVVPYEPGRPGDKNDPRVKRGVFHVRA